MASQPTNIRQNLPGSSVRMSDALDLLKKDIFLNLNCHAIGTIDSFDPERQTANVVVAYQKTIANFDQATGQYNYRLLNYPLLLDCPVVCLGGAGGCLTFPIKNGDECLVMFNDRDLDNWFAGQSGGTVATSRTHSFSDGVALVGVRSISNWIQNYDTERAVLRNGNASVGVGTEKINITNNITDLEIVLSNLIDAIESATYGGMPIDSTAVLEAVRTLMKQLLE